MEATSTLHMDVESSNSQVSISAQTSEGFSKNSQTGFMNSNGSNSSISEYAQQPSTMGNGSAPSNVFPCPSSSPANTQMVNTNPHLAAATSGSHGVLSSSTGPSESYSNAHAEGGNNEGNQFPLSTCSNSGHSVYGTIRSATISATSNDPQSLPRNPTPSAGEVYAPVPNQYIHPHTYGPGTGLPSMISPVPSPLVPFPSSLTQHAEKISFHGVSLLRPDSQLPNLNLSTAHAVHPMQSHVRTSLSSNAVAATTPNARPGTWTSPIPANPVVPLPGNSVGPHNMFAAHPMPVIHTAHWQQGSHPSALPRPQYLPYPSNVPAPFPGVPHPSFTFTSSEPLRVSSAAFPSAPPLSSSAPGLEMRVDSGMVPDMPPGTGAADADSEHSNAWTSHKTEAGVIYYYNALTGESTYERPPGFKEVTITNAQPTPSSWEKVTGTDWVSVTTNDGKKYYYNSKTKLSSWQIPAEVVEMTRKQDVELHNEHPTLISTNASSTNKESGPTRLDTPAINPENHDMSSSKSMVLPGIPASSSALDSIKKKLQDSVTLENVSLTPAALVLDSSGVNGLVGGESTLQSESNKEKPKNASANNNLADSSSDSDDFDSGPTKEQCIVQFKEMLKERGVAPFSKWEKELPKIVFDSRFKAIPSHSMRRSLFDHYVKTRAEEERKEKRAAQKAAIDGFKQLLQEASEDIDHNTNYNSFKSKWGNDTRFKALNRKDIELLLNERVIPLIKAAEEKAQAIRAEATSLFKSMLKEKSDINTSTRWSKVKDSLRSDPRYRSVKHEDREILFNEYVSELKAAEEEKEREVKSKRQEQEKLRERERELRKRKEREEEEIERMRLKIRRKEVVSSYQALLVEVIKDPQASWTESKPKLEKDPQGRASNPELESSELEKLFREHVNMLLERCASEYKVLLTEVLTTDVASQEFEDGKTVLNSWSTAKEFLKKDPRYSKMPRKEREILWRRYTESMQSKQKEAREGNEDVKARESHSRSKRRHENR